LTAAEPPASPPARSPWLSPGRIAGTGGILLLIVVLILWLAPSGGYDLQLVDPAHPVAPLLHIKGEHPARGGGSIWFVDVRERPARLIERLLPWTRADGSSLVRSPPISSSLEQRLGEVQMADSQKVAPYVALKYLGYNVSARIGGVTVLAVEHGAPAAHVVRPNDLILTADGQRVKTIVDLHAALAHKRPGDRVTLRFRRGEKVETATLATVADPEDPKRAIIGISALDDLQVRLPIRVTINAGGIGGPSAGLAFALDILQELGRNVAHGRKVAATGELRLNGEVEPIGGVKQKTLGARRAGVDVFLVPAGENAREARQYADGLRIVPVESFQQALRKLATLGPKA
jgi:PDZ domain-containing protein